MIYDGVKETARRKDEQRQELKGGGFFKASLKQITRQVEVHSQSPLKLSKLYMWNLHALDTHSYKTPIRAVEYQVFRLQPCAGDWGHYGSACFLKAPNGMSILLWLQC